MPEELHTLVSSRYFPTDACTIIGRRVIDNEDMDFDPSLTEDAI